MDIIGIDELLINTGFNAIEETSESKKFNVEKDGYKFRVDKTNLVKHYPMKFSYHNPFTIYNIKRYLKEHANHMELVTKVYEKQSAPLEFRCKKHNKSRFTILSNVLRKPSSGCSECKAEAVSRNKISDNETFIKKARLVHGDKFDYSLVIYEKSCLKVKIICPIHSVFEQSPNKHLFGGCYLCSRAMVTSNGLTRKAFIKNSIDKGVDKSILYLIECTKGDEKFFKVGITQRDIKTRFKTSMPYKYRVLWSGSGSAENVWDLEYSLLEITRENKFSPSIKFYGYTECFSSTFVVDKIKKQLEENNDVQEIITNP